MPWFPRRNKSKALPAAALLDEIDEAEATTSAVEKTTLELDLARERNDFEPFLAQVDRLADDIARIVPHGWEARVGGHRYFTFGHWEPTSSRSDAPKTALRSLHLDTARLTRDGSGATDLEREALFATFAQESNAVIEAFMVRAQEQASITPRRPSLHVLRHLGIEPHIRPKPVEQATRYEGLHSLAADQLRPHSGWRAKDATLDIRKELRELAGLVELRRLSLDSVSALRDLINGSTSGSTDEADEFVAGAKRVLEAIVQETAAPPFLTRDELRAAVTEPKPLTTKERLSQLNTMVFIVAQNQQLESQAVSALSQALLRTAAGKPISESISGQKFRIVPDGKNGPAIFIGPRLLHGESRDGKWASAEERQHYLAHGVQLHGAVAREAGRTALAIGESARGYEARQAGGEELRQRFSPGAFEL